MTIGLLLIGICSGLLSSATAVVLDAGLGMAALSYMLGGSLGVSVFVTLAEYQRR